EGDEDRLNPQLMYYAAAARHTIPKFFAGAERIVLVILQPQSIEPGAEMVSAVEVSHVELDEYARVLRTACEQALLPTPPLKSGGWCRFCPAKPICPEHTKPLLDLAQFVMPAPLKSNGAAPPDKEKYFQVLANALDLFDRVKDLRTTV